MSRCHAYGAHYDIAIFFYRFFFVSPTHVPFSYAQIVGLDSHPVSNGPDADKLFNSFCDALWNVPWIRSSLKILTVEKGSGHENTRYLEPFMSRRNVMCTVEKDGDTSGWRQTNAKKVSEIDALERKLSERAVCYMQNMVCACPWKPKEDRAAATKKTLEEQLTRFRMTSIGCDNLASLGRCIVSGKIGSDGRKHPDLQDDLALSLAMNIYVGDRLARGKVPGTDLGRALRLRRNA